MIVDVPQRLDIEIQNFAHSRAISAEDAVIQLLESALRSTEGAGALTPAQRLMGLFSSAEDSALIDEVTQMAYEGRSKSSTRKTGL